MGCKQSSCVRSNSPSPFNTPVREIFKIGRVLGSGAFGQVRECVHRETKKAYAIKIMVKTSPERGHWSNENMFRREVNVLSILDHPFVIKCHAFYEDANYLYAVLEKCDGGELFDSILRNGTLSERRASFLAYQMFMALGYVHSKDVVHRDIKAENFLFVDSSADSPIKLIDFGMSQQLEPSQVLTDVCGSPHYLAPELLKRSYGVKADVWAMGVLTYLMLYGKYPFDGNSTSAIVKDILTKKISWTEDGGVSELANRFIKSLLQRNWERRPSCEQVLHHPWLAAARAYYDPSPFSPRFLASTIGDDNGMLDVVASAIIKEGDFIVIGKEETRYSQRNVKVR